MSKDVVAFCMQISIIPINQSEREKDSATVGHYKQVAERTLT